MEFWKCKFHASEVIQRFDFLLNTCLPELILSFSPATRKHVTNNEMWVSVRGGEERSHVYASAQANTNHTAHAQPQTQGTTLKLTVGHRKEKQPPFPG